MMTDQTRPLPHSQDAEEAVCGSLLIDGESIYSLNPMLAESDFYSEQTRFIFGACLALHQRNETINQITVAQELARGKRLEDVGGGSYLGHLIAICPTSLDIEAYAAIVRRLSMMRQLADACRQGESLAYAASPDVDSTIDQVESLINHLRLGNGHESGFATVHDTLMKYLDSPGADEQKPEELSTGFPALDAQLQGGLQPGKVYILAGKTSMGKTALAMSIARNVCTAGGSVVDFSLEMTERDLILRLLSSETGIPTLQIKRKTHKQPKLLDDVIGVMADWKLYIDDRGEQKIASMRSKLKRLAHDSHIDLLIVDHLGLVTAEGKRENRNAEVGSISRGLHALAKELNVPLIALCQLSRNDNIRQDKTPTLSDLRDSGTIEQDADVVMFVYREEYYWSAEKLNNTRIEDIPEAEIIVAKHRDGPVGIVELHWNPMFARFEDLSSKKRVNG